MRTWLKGTGVALAALAVGVGIGFVAGWFVLSREWEHPIVTVSAADATRAAHADADATPPAGTKIVKRMPIGRVRLALAQLTAGDPVLARSASVGSSDDGNELHVMVENRGVCAVTAASGVAYGFDPRGRAARMNKNGENYVAFKIEAPIPPGKKGVASMKLRYAEDATLAVGHVDATTCADGTTWKRQWTPACHSQGRHHRAQ